MKFNDTCERFQIHLTNFLGACDAELERIVKKHHPDATLVELEGEWNEDHLLVVHPCRVRLSRPNGAYVVADDKLVDEAWEPLSYLAELTGTDLVGSHVVEFS